MNAKYDQLHQEVKSRLVENRTHYFEMKYKIVNAPGPKYLGVSFTDPTGYYSYEPFCNGELHTKSEWIVDGNWHTRNCTFIPVPDNPSNTCPHIGFAVGWDTEGSFYIDDIIMYLIVSDTSDDSEGETSNGEGPGNIFSQLPLPLWLIAVIGGGVVLAAVLFVLVTCCVVIVCCIVIKRRKGKSSNGEDDSMEMSEMDTPVGTPTKRLSVKALILDKVFGIKNADIYIEQEKMSQEAYAKLKINEDLFQIDFEKIKLLKQIGKGGSDSTIYKSDWGGTNVAVKLFQFHNFGNQKNFDAFESEIQIMARISHPNIVRFFGCSCKPPRVGILLEYCDNGDLLQRIQSGKMALKESCFIVNGIALGMAYLHEMKIIHRDLKPENILLDSSNVPKIIDFGISKLVNRFTKDNKTSRIGTSFYMAPEIVMGIPYDEKCDVFSFAIVMFICLTSNTDPFNIEEGGREMTGSFGLEMKIANGGLRPKLPSSHSYPDDLVDCMILCWDRDPNVRPSFAQVKDVLKAHC